VSNQLPAYRWIKFAIDYLNDPGWMNLADATVSVYVKLYLLAGRAAAGGVLSNGSAPYNLKDIAWQLRLDPGILETALDELIAAGFVIHENNQFILTKFLDEQGPSDNTQRSQWKEQQRRHRQKLSLLKEENKELEENRREKSATSQADVSLTENPYSKSPKTTSRGGLDCSDFPEDIRPLVQKMCDLWKLIPPRIKTGDFKFWVKSARSLADACAEFGVEAIEQAYYANLRSPYTVASPQSLVNTCRSEAGKLRKIKPVMKEPDQPQYTPEQLAEIKRAICHQNHLSER
jgi:hypothetical protein